MVGEEVGTTSNNHLKLHLGSRKKRFPGYLNVDIEEHPGVDLVADFRKLDYSNQVESIRAHHLLEHFSREEGIVVLKQWHSWLIPGGTLIVETPDFEGICQNLSKDPYWMTRHAYGSQEAGWAFHRDGWYEEKFKQILPIIGFDILSISKSVSRKILPNITVVAKKR